MSRQMKDSGIEWIGEIPADWDTVKMKYLASIGSGEAISKEDYLDEGEYDIIGANGSIGKLNITNNNCRVLTTGRVGTVGTVHKVKEAWITDNTLIISPNHKVNYDFLYWVIPNFDFSQMISGTAMPLITATKIINQGIPFPSMEEQIRIADYLDQQCAHIDAVIEKTKASIEEYKKLKQAVITQAVTKGIRGDRPMKDSGIEWIGETPSEWSLIPFRRVLKERNEKNTPIKSTERLSLSIELGVTLYSEKTTNLDRFKDDFEQYKLAHEGDLVMNSMNMIVGASGVSNYYGCISPVYYTYYDEEEDHVTAKYCEYIFRSKTMLRVLYSLGKGIYAIVRGDDRVNTCRLKVAKEDLKSLIIPVPSVDEQREIVRYLNQKCIDIEEVIKKKELFLSELESYKKSIIYEYVTGKKEVPQSCQ